MNKQKGLAPILIVLLIALGIGGYLIYQKQAKPVAVPQQTSESTPVPAPTFESTNSVASSSPNGAGEFANWKTYTNTKYGFIVNYPSDWKVGEFTVPVSLNKSGDSAPIVNFQAPGFPTPGVGLDGGIGFFVHMPEGDKVLADWVKDNGYKSPDAAYETIKMAGYNAVRINSVMTQDRRNEILSLPGGRGGPMPVGYKAIFIYIQKGDFIFQIQAGKITNPDDFLKIVDQILSTFKFTQ